MEKFFTPVYRPPTQEEMKLRKPKSHHHYQNDHPQHHPHPHVAYHSQDNELHSYAKLDGTDDNTDDSHAHHHQNHHRRHRQGHHVHENLPHDFHQPGHPQRHQHPSSESETQNPQQTTVTLSRASSSSSSLSSSSSSSLLSSYSWHTETSAKDLFSTGPTQRPHHSLSCSNILEVRTAFRQDGGSEPIVFATVKRGVPEASACDRTGGRPRQNTHAHASSLVRGQSHSNEGLLLTSEDEAVAGAQRRAARPHHGGLYKTASLGRSLAFSEENLVLGASGRPGRGVSTNQIPGKGILKNREPQPDIRKAKSMEVLSPRVANRQGKGEDNGKGSTPAEIQIAKENFVQGKLQFSAFLDEITKQVISPSNLNILGVNQVKSPGETPDSVRGAAKPQLPIKKHRESCSGEEREQHHKPPATQEKREPRGHSLSYHSSHPDQSDPNRLTSYGATWHRGSPPLHPHPQTSSHHPHPGGNRKDAKLPVVLGHKARESDVRRGSHLTDGTCTSPEPVLPKQQNHRKHWNTSPHSPPPLHPQHPPHFQTRHGCTIPGHQEEGHGAHKALGSALGPESEPGSCKSDSSEQRSSRTRDTASASNSQNSDRSVRHRSHTARKGHTDPHKVSLGGLDQFQALQEENTDLHQNLLQTVVCIESLEAELTRTREELSCLKDKHRRLSTETPTGTHQHNPRLGEHLHMMSESPSSERKYLINSIAELSSELEEAQRTIAALETINVPSLIKELLEKHFDSTEAVQKFLKTATTVNHSKTPSPPDPSQSGPSNVVEVPYDWLTQSEAGPHRVTAFMPWKQEASAAAPSPVAPSAAAPSADGGLSGAHNASQSQPFSIADISTAIYMKIASEIAANHMSSQPKSVQGCPKGTNHTSTAGTPAHGQQVPETAELAPGHEDVTYLSAQQVLDEFIHQLHPQNQASDGEEQQPHMSTTYKQE